ncbi:ADP/ATP carrier protein [Mucor velutinosus]|uniref:ADP/ATP carrier protein n=1 Tax=Mucor velutinosus TaxID=708070 RepID=A0AAN7HTT9_9FUNG|nr:ADP/ATP carrier protein [Mucor velutinosus]
MFDAPTSTLYNSLNTLLDSPKEYLADVCFTFPSTEIYAHRAIILTRAPREFLERYLPELLEEDHIADIDLPIKLDISNIISQDVFTPLLRFWYTASYYSLVSPQSSISDLSVNTPINGSPRLTGKDALLQQPAIQSPPPGFQSSDIQQELEQLGIELGTALLPPHCDSVPDFVQLVSDLKRMRDEKIATDVTVSLISSSSAASNDVSHSSSSSSNNSTQLTTIPSLLSTSPENHIHPVDITVAEFRAHRFLLAAQSPYFYSLFCTQFQEASSTMVHLTDDLFNEAIIEVVLNFFYTDKIIVKPLPTNNAKLSSPLQRRLQHNKHALRVIQKAFYSADYLGHSDTLGGAILHEMERLCHQFKCVCAECAVLLPSMLAWSDKHVEAVPKLRRTLILLYSDPVHSLAPLWSQRPFAMLITSMVPSAASLGEDTLAAVTKQEPLFRARTPKTLIHEIVERTFYNVTKHNAIHVLHSLHLCLSQIRSADPCPSWSRPALDLVNPILHYTVGMVSQFFDFYCVEYPILLSCVDGIGAGFSVDFLDFLLRHVLNEGITETNAGVIYQGILRDLVGRQEVVQNMAIDDVLIKGRSGCAAYIAKNWTKVKSQGGFRTLDKSTMRQLAEDINVPYRSLTKPFDTDFSNIFSFKPRKSKKYYQNAQDCKNAALAEVYTRRLSLGHLMTRSSTTQASESSRRVQRPRALSTESVLVSSLRRYHTDQTAPPSDNQPLINMLAYETLERGRQLEEEDNRSEPLTNTMSVEEHEIQTATQNNTIANTLSEFTRPLLRTSSSFTSLTDQLLPVDVVLQTHVSPTSPPPSSQTMPACITTRPSRLKFELPTTPARSKSPSAPSTPSSSSMPSLYIQTNNNTNASAAGFLSPPVNQKHSRNRRGSKTRRSRWSIGSNSDVSDDEESSLPPAVGDKIELLRRPLPTMGTIKYIGPVQFAEGPYIGVELESRLGKSDGSVDGVRYFHTDPQRALFVKPDDFKILSNSHTNNHHR